MNKPNQISIAKEVGITQGHLSKVLAGKANPTLNLLKKIAAAYGIKVTTLIKRIDERAAA